MVRRLWLRVRPGERRRPFEVTAALMVALVLHSAPSVSRADDPRAARSSPRFDDGTAQILRRRCVRCHGGATPDAALSLTEFSGVMRGGETGPAVIEGN